jgi:hypothetical protein
MMMKANVNESIHVTNNNTIDRIDNNGRQICVEIDIMDFQRSNIDMFVDSAKQTSK